MLLRSMLAPVTRASANSGIPSQGLPPLGSIGSASGMLVSQGTAMTVSAWYACVTIRSEDVARCTPGLFKVDEDGDRGERVTDHPIARLLRKPNRVQTWFEFAEQMQGALMQRTNAYAAILRDRKGDPAELIPINPDAVLVLEAGDGQIFYQVNRIGLWQMAMLRDFPTAVPAEDMFHLRGFTFNSLMGTPRIGLARDSIGLAMGMDQQASRWMGNGARPAGVLQAKTSLSVEAAKRLKAQWDEFTRGIQNVGSTAVLEQGVEWKQLSLDAGQLDFFNQRNFQVEDICRWFRMPPHKLGRLEKTATTGLAQQNQDYVSNTIAPDLERWEQKFAYVFNLFDEDLMVDFDEKQLLKADIKTRYDAHRIGILSGFETPAEARKDEGKKFIKGSDKLLVPANTAALGSEANGQAADGGGRPAGGAEPSPAVSTGGEQPDTNELGPED
jgi:HK97 family phage portal protein